MQCIYQPVLFLKTPKRVHDLAFSQHFHPAQIQYVCIVPPTSSQTCAWCAAFVCNMPSTWLRIWAHICWYMFLPFVYHFPPVPMYVWRMFGAWSFVKSDILPCFIVTNKGGMITIWGCTTQNHLVLTLPVCEGQIRAARELFSANRVQIHLQHPQISKCGALCALSWKLKWFVISLYKLSQISQLRLSV